MTLVCFFHWKEIWEAPWSEHPDALLEKVSCWKMILLMIGLWKESMDVIQSQQKQMRKNPCLDKLMRVLRHCNILSRWKSIKTRPSLGAFRWRPGIFSKGYAFTRCESFTQYQMGRLVSLCNSQVLKIQDKSVSTSKIF